MASIASMWPTSSWPFRYSLGYPVTKPDNALLDMGGQIKGLPGSQTLDSQTPQKGSRQEPLRGASSSDKRLSFENNCGPLSHHAGKLSGGIFRASKAHY